MVEGGSMSLDTEQLAYLVLEAANRTQGKGTTVRLILPSAPEVTNELNSTFAEHELYAAEEYLLERGHITPANIGLTWGTYTITQAGLEWLEEGVPEPLEAPHEGADPRPAAGVTREDIEVRQHGRVPRWLQRGLDEERKQLGEERSWWSRVFGGSEP
jgi:hypothetical protein